MKQLFGGKTKNKTKNACIEKNTVSSYAANALKSCNEITKPTQFSSQLHKCSAYSSLSKFQIQSVSEVKKANIISKKQQFLCVLSEKITASIRINLSSCTKKLLTGNACSWGWQILLGSRFKEWKLATVPVRIDVRWTIDSRLTQVVIKFCVHRVSINPTDKSPYLQCRCNQLSQHSTCHWSQPPILSAHWSQNAAVCFRFLWPKMLIFTPKNKKNENSWIHLSAEK